MTPKPTLRIGHGNGHNEQSLVSWVRAAEADSFSALESQRLLPDLMRLRKHRVTVAGDDWSEDRNRAKSTAIITRSKHESLGEFTRKVSERLKPDLRVALGPGAGRVVLPAPDRGGLWQGGRRSLRAAPGRRPEGAAGNRREPSDRA